MVDIMAFSYCGCNVRGLCVCYWYNDLCLQSQASPTANQLQVANFQLSPVKNKHRGYRHTAKQTYMLKFGML